MAVIFTLIRLVVVAAIAGGVIYGAGFRLENVYAGRGDAKDTKETEDRTLFLNLIKYQVVKPRPDSGLELMEPDHFLIERASPKKVALSEAQEEFHKQQVRLHGILYFAPVGGLIREQVRLWNDTRYLAAIRDNRPRKGDDFTSEWEVFSKKGHPLRTGDLVPESFGFVLDNQLRPGFSDWAAVSRRGGSVTFRSRVPATSAGEVMVQVVGKPISWSPRSGKVKQLTGKPQFGCGEPTGAALVFPMPRGGGALPISVTVEPSVSCERRINGLAIRMTKDAVGKYTAYEWRPIKRASSATSKFVITTSDGVLLTEPDGSGRPTQAAYDLGLVPLVGFGPGATLAISGIMAGAKLPPRGVTAAITIDSRLQRAAQAAVLKQMERMRNSRGTKDRKSAIVFLDGDTGAILAAANFPLMPGGARAWDYAAFSAAYPLRDPATIIAWGVTDINNAPGSTFKPLVALSVTRMAKGAEVPFFHRVLEGLSPGEISSVMGLTPGQHAYQPNGAGTKQSIANFGSQGLGPFAGMPARNAECTRNAGPDTRTGQPPGTLGVRQGIQHSINVYFARLSNLLDRPRLKQIVATLVKNKAKHNPQTPLGEAGVTRLIESLRSLGVSDKTRMDLATNLPPGVVLRRFNTGTAADVLYPQLASQAILLVPIDARPAAIATLRHVSALNGIGQSVAVHPLHMARGALTIATGKLMTPYIFQSWGGEILNPPPSKPLYDRADPNYQQRMEMLLAIRQGMKLVPETSTARAAFAATGDIKCRAYGKTGTAEIVKKTGQHSAWFIGWREPKGKPLTLEERRQRRLNNLDIHPRERRLVYACMTTHGFGGFRTGGSSCAPIVADTLVAMEKKEEPKKKKARPGRRARRN